MSEYDGPVFNQNKTSQFHATKKRRFNQMSQREVDKTRFEPALKERKKLYPERNETVGFSEGKEKTLFPPRKHQRANQGEMEEDGSQQRNFEEQVLEQIQELTQKQTQVSNQRALSATPQDDYQIPFLKRQDKQRKQLDRASLANAMQEHQLQPMNQPSKPNRPIRVETSPAFENEAILEEDKQETNETSKKTNYEHETIMDKKPQPVFQPTELPKPYKGNERRNEDVEEIRELAKRLVKTKDTFLLFEH